MVETLSLNSPEPNGVWRGMTLDQSQTFDCFQARSVDVEWLSAVPEPGCVVVLFEGVG